MERMSVLLSSLLNFSSRKLSTYPGQGMEETNPVTCSVEFEKILDPSVLQPGDSVTVDVATLLCRHVGIYVGNGEIIDFANELRKVTLAVFTEGESLSRVQYTQPPPDCDPEQVVQRALDALKNPELVGSYDVISNNSEHFVTYCTFEKHLSYKGVKAAKEADPNCVAIESKQCPDTKTE